MNLFLKFIGTCIIFQLGVSCSFVSTSAEINNYYIEYSSGGGLTGIESGISIGNNRSVKYWERKSNSPPILTDSTELTLTQLNTFNKLMKSKEILAYKNDYRGNYTGRLTFVNNDSINTFSFNPSNLPNNMPDAIKDIIVEIHTINRHK